MMKQESPSNSDALAFSKREQLDKKGAVPDSADVAFSKKAQQAERFQLSDLPPAYMIEAISDRPLGAVRN